MPPGNARSDAPPAAAALGEAPRFPIAAPSSPLQSDDAARLLWEQQGASLTAHDDGRLATIDASDAAVSDADLASLEAFPNLKHLNLRGTAITDAGLAALKYTPQLEFLGLSRTAVTDAGLTQLEHLSQLRYLTLAETSITDAGLTALGRLKSLEGLNLKGTQLTRDGLNRLQSDLPRCRIVADESLLAAGKLFQSELTAAATPRPPRLIAPGDALSASTGTLLIPAIEDGTPAERLSRILEEHFADPRLLLTLGDLYRERGELAAAVAAYEEAATRAPDDQDIRYRLGVALAELGDLAEARRQLHLAVGAAAGDYNIAVVLFRQGRVKDCREALDAALAADPAFSPARQLQATLVQATQRQVETAASPAPSPTVALLLRALQAEVAATQPRGWEVAIQPATPFAQTADLTAAAASAEAETAPTPVVSRAVLADVPVPVIEPLSSAR